MPATWSLARERAVYLWVIFAIPAVSTFGHYLAPNQPLVKGQDAGIVGAYAMALVAFALWLPYRAGTRWGWLTKGFLGSLAVVWLYQVTRIQLDASLFNITALLVPVVIAGILLKPPGRRDMVPTLLTLCYSLLAIALVSLTFGSLGWLPDGFAVSDGGGQHLPFLEVVGIHSRWGGPFGSVNYASPIGGLLVVSGAALGGRHRWVLILGGLLVLALGQGRAAVIATIAGLIVILLWSGPVRRLSWRRALRVGVLFGTVSAVMGYIAIVDPTFAYRDSIWASYLGLVPRDPLIGVGDSGVREFLGSPVLNPDRIVHDHAHSVMLDGLVRWGSLWLLLTLLVFGLAAAAGMRALGRQWPLPLALVVFVIAAGLVETLHSWTYLTVYMATLAWSAMAADPSPTEDDEASALGRHSISWRGAGGLDGGG